jgi:hypothetical protein
VEEARQEGWLARFLQAFDPFFLSRQGGLSSRFNREPVDPGAGFQLGWGGQDDFRILGFDTASILTGRTTWTAGGGIRLPLNVHFSGNYSDSWTQILHVRSDRELRNRAWPDLRVGVTGVTPPESWGGILTSVSLNTGFRKNLQESTFGGRGLQRRSRTEHQVPLDVTALWGGDVSTRYRGTFIDGDGEDPTGDTRSQRRIHSFLVSSSFARPPLLTDRIDGPLRVSAAFQYSSELNCRVPAGQNRCIPFVDLLNRSVNLTLDTVVTPLEVGLHLTYTRRRSFVGRHDGSTQFQLGIFGQFLFNSGSITPTF